MGPSQEFLSAFFRLKLTEELALFWRQCLGGGLRQNAFIANMCGRGRIVGMRFLALFLVVFASIPNTQAQRSVSTLTLNQVPWSEARRSEAECRSFQEKLQRLASSRGRHPDSFLRSDVVKVVKIYANPPLASPVLSRFGRTFGGMRSEQWPARNRRQIREKIENLTAGCQLEDSLADLGKLIRDAERLRFSDGERQVLKTALRRWVQETARGLPRQVAVKFILGIYLRMIDSGWTERSPETVATVREIEREAHLLKQDLDDRLKKSERLQEVERLTILRDEFKKSSELTRRLAALEPHLFKN